MTYTAKTIREGFESDDGNPGINNRAIKDTENKILIKLIILIIIFPFFYIVI